MENPITALALCAFVAFYGVAHSLYAGRNRATHVWLFTLACCVLPIYLLLASERMFPLAFVGLYAVLLVVTIYAISEWIYEQGEREEERELRARFRTRLQRGDAR